MYLLLVLYLYLVNIISMFLQHNLYFQSTNKEFFRFLALYISFRMFEKIIYYSVLHNIISSTSLRLQKTKIIFLL